MAEKESHPKQWSYPKDFGLPFVEISPLAKVKSKTKEVNVAVPVAAPEVPKSVPVPTPEPPKSTPVPAAEPPKSSPVTPPTATPEKKKETKPSRPVVAPTPLSKNNKKKSKTWVWVVFLALIAAISVIVFQIQMNQNPVVGNENIVVDQPTNPIPPKQTIDSSALTGLDSLPVQDSTTIPSSDLSLTSSNSGTSIATNPKITRIDKRESYRRFFLIIGSFGSEEETVRYIQRPENKFSEYYLVLPFEENPNYRLAIGAYRNWDEASAKLTEMKAQNAKGYWILNY
jgi:hypothetical protein